MFRSSYNKLNDEKNMLKASLPPVFCSALSASIRMDYDDDTPRFSSLAASILDQRREREIAERREKAAGKNCQNPLGKKRRRHPAGDIKNHAVDVQDIMEPLVILRPEDEENVEFKTLLEQVTANPENVAQDKVQQHPSKKVRLGTKLRKMSSSSIGLKKSVEDCPDGLMANVKTFIQKIFSS